MHNYRIYIINPATAANKIAETGPAVDTLLWGARLLGPKAEGPSAGPSLTKAGL